MGTEGKSHKLQIAIAIIGLIGVLGSALFANWDKIFAARNNNKVVTGGSGSSANSLNKNSKIVNLATSFDCQKAETGIEKIICDNPQISHVDGHLDLLYKTLKNKMTATDYNALKIEQRQWIKNRDSRIVNYCQSSAGLNLECVTTIYNQRIDEFKVMLEKI